MPDLSRVRALAFDVFGTTVDWCSGVARDSERMLTPHGYTLDWIAFANRWRSEYQPAMEGVRSGERPYVTMDTLHREMLEVVLPEFSVTDLSETEKDNLAHAWRRLDPWADVIPGMQRLKRHFILAAVSNANIALAVAMAKRAGLPWDVILGSQVVQTYKPMARVYDSVPAYLDLEPAQVLMVACHVWDLDAAKARGLSTAFIPRPDEYGPGKGGPPAEAGAYDMVASDFGDLARQLGA